MGISHGKTIAWSYRPIPGACLSTDQMTSCEAKMFGSLKNLFKNSTHERVGVTVP